MHKMDRQQTEDKVNEIAGAICRPDIKDVIPPGLMNGKMGMAIFLLHYARYAADQEKHDRACEYVGEIIREINKGFSFPAFAEGLAGIAWGLMHIKENELIEMDLNGSFRNMDAFLAGQARNCMANNRYDFLHGLLGMGLYFLKRKDVRTVEAIVHWLEEQSEITGSNGRYWLAGAQQENRNRIDMGLSHGQASILVYLAKCYKSNFYLPKTMKLMEGSVNFFLSIQQQTGNTGSVFPSFYTPGKREISRMAWCYGDPGIGWALLYAAHATQNERWLSNAIEILQRAALRRNPETNGVADACLCHGSAGLSYIFRKVCLLTGHTLFQNASDYWLNETLKFSRFSDGIAGFKKAIPGKPSHTNEPGLLEGAAGIGLSLLHILTDNEPGWDECLLLS